MSKAFGILALLLIVGAVFIAGCGSESSGEVSSIETISVPDAPPQSDAPQLSNDVDLQVDIQELP